MFQGELKILYKKFKKHMNGSVSSSMREKGLNYNINFGLDAISLKQIASTYEPSVDYAEFLYAQVARECKILATMLYPKDSFTPEKADEWLRTCPNNEIVEQLCFNLLQYCDFAEEKSLEWMSSCENKFAGFTLAMRIYLKHIPLIHKEEMLSLAKENMNSDDFVVKLAANKLLDRMMLDLDEK